MGLPLQVLPTKTVQVGEGSVEIRSLSRSEALRVTQDFTGNADGAEVFILSRGAGVTEEEAIAWRDATDPITAGKVIDAIIYLTGLVEEDAKDPK